jgi:hypothetical protein
MKFKITTGDHSELKVRDEFGDKLKVEHFAWSDNVYFSVNRSAGVLLERYEAKKLARAILRQLGTK